MATHKYGLTLTCPKAIVIAAADVNPLITGTGMKSTRKPTQDKERNQLYQTCTSRSDQSVMSDETITLYTTCKKQLKEAESMIVLKNPCTKV